MTTTPTASPELLDLDKLEALARAATPGRWMRLFGERTVYDRMEDGCRGNAIVRADLGYGLQDISNLDFIASANPAAVLALIALARRAQPYATGGTVPGGLHLVGEAPQATCTVPPEGWHCTRAPGHDGPCAAWPIAQRAAAPGALDEQALRDMFERDAATHLGIDHAINRTSFRRDDDGGYQYAATRRLFALWKAARASAAPSAPGTPEAPTDPVVEANRQLLLDRSRVGLIKYGKPLEATSLSHPELTQHALEEALDLANYLQAILRKQRAAQIDGGQEGSAT